MLLKAVLVTLIWALSHATHDVIRPKIKVLSPEGFRVSFEDAPGITSADFHVKINIDERAVKYSKTVNRQRNGKWTFTNRRVVVEPGSLIHFDVLVHKYNRGYLIAGLPFLVADKRIQSAPTKNNSIPTISKPVTSTASPPSAEPTQCEDFIWKTTQAIISLESEMQTLKKANQKLEKFLERYPDAKTLTLGGRVPPDDDAHMVVKFILREKLDLEPKIVSSVRNSDNNITFEVATLNEKSEILDRAKYKLLHSKIVIY